MVLSAERGESVPAMRMFEDPVLGFGNDDLWSWEAVVVLRGEGPTESDIAVEAGPD